MSGLMMTDQEKKIRQQIFLDKEENVFWLRIGLFGDVTNEIHITVELSEENLLSLFEEIKKELIE